MMTAERADRTAACGRTPLPATGVAAVGVAALLLLAPAGRAVASGCASGAVSVAAARAAVEFVGNEVRAAHFHAPLTAEDPAVVALARTSSSLSAAVTPAELARRVNAALGAAHDGHLRLELAPAAVATCATLPLNLDWTEAGLLVLPGSAIPAGSRILSIGGRSLEQLDDLAAASIPHENEYWVHSTFAHEVARADILAGYRLLERDGSVAIAYQSGQADPTVVRLMTAPHDPAPHPWVAFEIFEADSTAVFRLERCDPNDEFYSTLAAFLREVKAKHVRKVVVDLRGNPGGDASVATAVFESLGLAVAKGFAVDVRVSAPLLHDMPMFEPAGVAPAFEAAGLPAPAADARRYTFPGPIVLGLLAQRRGDHVLEYAPGPALYVLTDGGTFSSASLFAVLVRDNQIGTLVGEPTGNSATFNGSEIERPLPGLPYVLHVSTARLVRPDAGAGPAPTLIPDLRAPRTAASIAAGRDAAVELIRHL